MVRQSSSHAHRHWTRVSALGLVPARRGRLGACCGRRRCRGRNGHSPRRRGDDGRGSVSVVVIVVVVAGSAGVVQELDHAAPLADGRFRGTAAAAASGRDGVRGHSVGVKRQRHGAVRDLVTAQNTPVRWDIARALAGVTQRAMTPTCGPRAGQRTGDAMFHVRRSRGDWVELWRLVAHRGGGAGQGARGSARSRAGQWARRARGGD